MIRNNGTGRLHREPYEYKRKDVNPMHGLANLVDAMLVLAVGIMVAVVTGWNLDLSELKGDINMKSIDSDDVETVSKDAMDPNEEYLENVGTLLYDKENDTYYLLSDSDRAKELTGDSDEEEDDEDYYEEDDGEDYEEDNGEDYEETSNEDDLEPDAEPYTNPSSNPSSNPYSNPYSNTAAESEVDSSADPNASTNAGTWTVPADTGTGTEY